MRNCEDCINCIPLGEGDHVCEETGEVVLIDYLPTKDYGQCEGMND